MAIEAFSFGYLMESQLFFSLIIVAIFDTLKL